MIALMAATALDTTAAVLHRVAGDTGDRIASRVLAPVRSRINTGCTRCARSKCTDRT